MFIIGVSGLARSGKDTFANYVEDLDPAKVHVMAFADPLKLCVKHMYGLNGDQLWGHAKEELDPYWKKTPRQILQEFGTDVVRNHVDREFWIKRMRKKLLEITRGRDCRDQRLSVSKRSSNDSRDGRENRESTPRGDCARDTRLGADGV